MSLQNVPVRQISFHLYPTLAFKYKSDTLIQGVPKQSLTNPDICVIHMQMILDTMYIFLLLLLLLLLLLYLIDDAQNLTAQKWYRIDIIFTMIFKDSFNISLHEKSIIQ